MSESNRPLNIVHIFRAPVGGLFRHVLDLARGQIERGHRVGLIADSLTGGERGAQALAELEPALALGLLRIPMRRQPGPGDVLALWRVSNRLRDTHADVAHGHGAKGGTYARLAPVWRPMVRAYTPHGGSVWFGYDTLAGTIVLTTERLLLPRGNLYLFESAFSRDVFGKKIGSPKAHVPPKAHVHVIHNGVTDAEFAPVALAPDATDLVFLGEFRTIKGIDILIEALATLHAGGRMVTATLVGYGPEETALRNSIERHKMTAAIRFAAAMPARQALALGRIMVAPSRADSFPYVVLETLACAKPIITTRVGGIPEMFGPMSDALVPPGDPAALAAAIVGTLDHPGKADQLAKALQDRVAKQFSTTIMVESVLAAYRGVLAEILAEILAESLPAAELGGR